MSSLAGNTYRRLLGALLAAAVCVLGGCVYAPQSPESRAQSSPKAVQLPPGEGLVAVKVAINRPQVSPFFRKWSTLVLWNEHQEKEYRLSDRSDSSAMHAFFVDHLPPGKYNIRGLYSEAANGYYEFNSSANARQVFPSFSIAAGRMTDLGTIAYVRAHYPAVSNRYAWGQVYAPQDYPAKLRQLPAPIAATAAAQPALGWDGSERLDELQGAFNGLRSTTMLLNSPTRLGDGTVLAGEAFGQIAVRSPGGNWRYVQTPTALPIRSLHAARDGALLAGSDDGILLYRRAGQDDWELLALPVYDASVIDIGPLPETAELLVTLQTRDRFIGLSTSAASPGQWTEQFSRPRALAAKASGDARGVMIRNANTVVFGSGGGIGEQETLTYDSKNRTWKPALVTSKGMAFFESDLVPLHWAAMGDGRLGRFHGVPLSGGRFFHITADGGATWEKRAELPQSFGPLIFVSDLVGYVARTAGPVEMEYTDDVKAGATLWKTGDAGRTWNQVGVLPAFPRRLVQIGGPEQLGFASDDGQFYSSADGGKNWMLENRVR